MKRVERLQDIVGRRIKAISKEDDGTITMTLLGHDTKIRFSSRDNVDHDHIVVAKVIRKTRTVTIDESVEEIE